MTEEALRTAPRSRPARRPRPRPTRFLKPLAWLSAAGGLTAAATLLAPRVPVPDTFGPALFERLWFDDTWQQWSGYLLLAFSVGALLFGARKRLRPARRFGSYNWWRLFHAGLGICCVLLLFAHTGFRLGANLNAVLMSCYVAALLLGALAGLSIAAAHDLREMGIGTPGRPLFRTLIMAHLAVLSLLPALLIAHVLVVYLY